MSAPGRWHNATDVRAKPCVLGFVGPPAEKFPVRAVDIVNPETCIIIHRLDNTANKSAVVKFQLIV